MTDKLSNSVTTSLDDDLYAFAKADSYLLNIELSVYMRSLVDKERNKRFSELSVFQDLMPIKKINK
tara:strand:- start:532 stop:729 length:198 start_codon:yes stop_codon:yes gene_type:complete